MSSGGNRGGSPEQFDDVFVSAKDLYKQGYVVDASKTISGMITPTQTEVIKETKTFACAVSAMLAVSSHYVTLNRLKLPDLYSELWKLSGTSDKGTKYDQATGLYFTQGGTLPDRPAPAIKEFCARRGKELETSFVWYPSWDSFRMNTDSGNLSIFSGRLRSNGGGHAMAVVGYVAMHNTYSNAKKYLLVVWNGWTNQLQFLPYDVSIYNAHDGTYCKG